MDAEFSCLMVESGPHIFGVPLPWIRTIVPTPGVLPLPESQPHVRGGVNLLDEWLPLVDLRRVCGLPPLEERLTVLKQTLKGHVAEHRARVEQGTLAGQPCSHTAWLTCADASSARMSAQLDKLADVHRKLQAVAKDGHAELVHRAFLAWEEEVGAYLQVCEDEVREVSVALDAEGLNVAIAVDAVHRVEVITRQEMVMSETMLRYADNGIAVLLDLHRLRSALGRSADIHPPAADARPQDGSAPGLVPAK